MTIAYFVHKTQTGNRNFRWKTLFISILAISVIVSMFSGDVITKITDDEVNPLSFSRFDRLASFMSGISMFSDHWLFGVGIQGYAFALPNYADPFIEDFFDWNSRRIANNIYAEWLAEYGIIGTLAMLMLLYKIIKPILSRKRHGSILLAGAVSILLSWLAFPSYTVSFHWIGLAVLVRLSLHSVIEPISVRRRVMESSLASAETSSPNAAKAKP